MYYTYDFYLEFQKKYRTGIFKIKNVPKRIELNINKKPYFILKEFSQCFNAFYNQIGKLIHLVNLHSEFKYAYFYNNQGRIVRILEIFKNSNMLNTENRIFYNDENNFTEEIRCNINGAYLYTYTIKHTFEDGVYYIIKDSPSDGELILNAKIINNNIIDEYWEIDGEGLIFATRVVLNKKQQEIKSYDLKEGGVPDLESTCITTYYNNGNVKSHSNKENEVDGCLYEYKYDKNGNWIEEIQTYDGIPIDIVDREITYHK